MSNTPALEVSTGAQPGSPWTWFVTPDRRILLLSIALQLTLGTLLGHSTDTRVFMATGYLVGTGHDPYVARDLTQVFHHILFGPISTVGYPPPWPLALGLIYAGSYALFHQLLVYNLALKLPVIVATVGLAYLVGAVLQQLGASPSASRRAWTFMLLNPFVLYVGAAWGQIDTIVALLALAALALLSSGRRDGSAGLLALAFAVKPIALPVLPVALVSLAAGSWMRAARYAAIFLGVVGALYVLPFFVFGWSLDPFLRHLNAHFLMHGTLSYMTVVRVFRDLDLLQGSWWLLGLIWVVALAAGAALLGRGDGSLDDLVRKSTALLLIVFLTRTWLAEANVMLVLPLILILTATGALHRRALTAAWVIPLLFSVLNASPLHLLWVQFPETMRTSLADIFPYGDQALLARAVLVVAWQVTGWWIVVVCIKGRRAVRTEETTAPLGAGAAGATEPAGKVAASWHNAARRLAPWR